MPVCLRSWGKRFLTSVCGAAPVILFFLVLFVIVYVLFGLQYSIIVSVVTTFFQVVLPMLKSTAVTIAILNTMWIWNDYLMPYLTIGTNYRTIPVAIQYLRGGYGAVDPCHA